MEYLALDERHGWKVSLGCLTSSSTGKLIMFRVTKTSATHNQHQIKRLDDETEFDYYLRAFREHGEIMARLGRKLPPFGDEAANRWPD